MALPDVPREVRARWACASAPRPPEISERDIGPSFSSSDRADVQATEQLRQNSNYWAN